MILTFCVSKGVIAAPLSDAVAPASRKKALTAGLAGRVTQQDAVKVLSAEDLGIGVLAIA
jgi:hypothetical protein